MRDFREVQLNPLPTVNAEPLMGNNLFEWHGNLKGHPCSPYTSTILHIEMHFPDTYPVDPPQVFLRTTIPHHNVFRDHICLDMLTSPKYNFWPDEPEDAKGWKAIHTGWTSAYSVQSILIQLQSFLFERAEIYRDVPDKEKFMKDYKGPKEVRDKKFKAAQREARAHNGRIDECIKKARNYKCECGHNMKEGKIVPAFRVEYKPNYKISEYTMKLQMERQAKREAELRAKRLAEEGKDKKETNQENTNKEEEKEEGEKKRRRS